MLGEEGQKALNDVKKLLIDNKITGYEARQAVHVIDIALNKLQDDERRTKEIYQDMATYREEAQHKKHTKADNMIEYLHESESGDPETTGPAWDYFKATKQELEEGLEVLAILKKYFRIDETSVQFKNIEFNTIATDDEREAIREWLK